MTEKKWAAALLLGLFAAAPASAYSDEYTHRPGGHIARRVPDPWLLAPRGETVDLREKTALTFKWSDTGDITSRVYYDFRLYAGRGTLQKNLLKKIRVSSHKNTVTLPAALFENGKIYTWAVRQVHRSGSRSRRNTHAFRVTR